MQSCLRMRQFAQQARAFLVGMGGLLLLLGERQVDVAQLLSTEVQATVDIEGCPRHESSQIGDEVSTQGADFFGPT